MHAHWQRIFLAAALVTARAALAAGPQTPLKTLVTFGDSYTDVILTGDSGTAWPVYAAGYANATLLPFARAGAACSQDLTPRNFPPLFQSQLPTYFAEVANGTIDVTPEDTLYTLWIGTNDVGVGELLTGGAARNVTIVDTTACAVSWVSALYDSGARNFLFQNMIPLDRLPIYAPDAYLTKYWTAPRNATEWHLFVSELVAAGNALSKLMLPSLAAQLPDAHVGLFDSYALFTDILENPQDFLNGTAPLNTTAALFACVFQENESTSDSGDCTEVEGTDRDSYVWFDELHPSEQSDRVVAREIANVLEGQGSKYVTWFI